MLIRDLFTKPIDRPINGVIKADQDDAASVWQELDEYVVTKELDIHFRKFIGAYLNAIDKAGDPDVVGKIGVWISGFFGSGKSHFLKILSYLLENREISYQGQTRRAIDFFDGKIQDAMLAGDIKRAVAADTDVILFNIDSKADSESRRDAILRVFLKVLNEKRGYSGDHPHLAEVERRLDDLGKLAEFKAAFHAVTGADWEQERDGYSFYLDEIVQALSDTAQALGFDCSRGLRATHGVGCRRLGNRKWVVGRHASCASRSKAVHVSKTVVELPQILRGKNPGMNMN